MNKRFCIRPMSIMKMFALLYPICPNYFYIAGMPFKEMILFISVILLTIFTKGGILTKRKKAASMFLEIIIWSTIFVMIQLYHNEWMQVFTQVLLWVGIVYFGSSVINTKEKFISIIDTVIIGSMIVGIFGIVEEITHFNIFSLLNTSGAILNYNPIRLGIFRIISFTSHAISYGCYCMIVFALIIYRVMIEKKRFLYIAGALMLVNEFFTLSRISIIGLAIEVVLILWFSGFQRFIKKLFESIIIVGILVAILCLISEKVRSALAIARYVVLALFDDSYVSILSGFGFTDNAGGIGHRFDLYKWVYEETKGNLLTGNGAYNLFEHSFINSAGYSQTKSSIEVQWLRTFYRYGIIGVASEIYMYLMLIVHSINKYLKKAAAWEGQVSFPRVFSALLIAYVIVMFGVMQNQDIQVFSVVVMSLLAYVQSKAYRSQYSNYEEARTN